MPQAENLIWYLVLIKYCTVLCVFAFSYYRAFARVKASTPTKLGTFFVLTF